MVAMGVRDENMRHRLVAHGLEQRGYMGGIVRAGIDNGDAAFADNVAQRALEGERPRIVRHHAAYAGHRLVDRARDEIEMSVKGDVIGHGECPPGLVIAIKGSLLRQRPKLSSDLLISRNICRAGGYMGIARSELLSSYFCSVTNAPRNAQMLRQIAATDRYLLANIGSWP